MSSPFPGMDPYLEGYLWPDLHNALATKIRQILTPLIRPRYTARLNIYVVEDTMPEGDVGVLYPDVEIMLAGMPRDLPGTTTVSASTTGAATPALLTIPVVLPIDVQLTNIEIRDTAHNRLITSIEILSPVNKREPGLAPYRVKRQRLYQAGVHLLELDLLRRGTRPVSHAVVPAVPYMIALTRAHTGKTALWPVQLYDPLPIVPVPLRAPDDDVVLDLGAALRAVYDEAAYELSLDYQQEPPPPAFSPAERAWIAQHLQR